MSCGKYQIKDKNENCGVERTYYATVCRNCLRYYGTEDSLYLSGNNCLGNISETYCNGDCEYDSERGICSLKTSESKFFIHFRLSQRMGALFQGLVFRYENYSDLEKKMFSVWEKRLKFMAEEREFVKKLRFLEQFIQTVKGQDNFW